MQKKSESFTIRLSESTQNRLKEMFPVLNIRARIEQAVFELHQIRNDRNIVTLNLDESLISDLRKLARNNKQTVENFIIENICLELRGHAIYCPKCNRPQFLESEIPLIPGQKVEIECSACGHSWEWTEDE